MADKPTTGHLDWIGDDDMEKYAEPSSAKKLAGWLKHEKPPFEHFNWAFRLIDRWLKYAEAIGDEAAVFVSNPDGTLSVADAVLDISGLIVVASTVVGPAGMDEYWELNISTSGYGGTFTLGNGTINTDPIPRQDGGVDISADIRTALEGIYGTGTVTVHNLAYDAYRIVIDNSVSPSNLEADLSGIPSLHSNEFGLWEAFLEWPALNAVPIDADWIEVGTDFYCTSTGATPGAGVAFDVMARKYMPGSSAGGDRSRLASVSGVVNTAGYARATGSFARKIPVDERRFQLRRAAGIGTFGTESVNMTLAGYGRNGPA